MRLIVGLGNPGREYTWTPHNLGFLAVDEIAARAGIRVTRPEAKSYIGHGQIVGQEVVLAKPQTMMNLSGVAVRMLLERCECGPADLMLLTDDFALPWGMLRIRERGSSGGHNGLKSVIGAIGTDEFLRVRMGVQPEQQWGDMADYLLCTMTTDQHEIATRMVAAVAEAVEVILLEGPGRAMSRFNRRVGAPGEMRA
jgi:peptidyl-tRNA hydrolase, PTH1 family